ncbi:hypothetical protein C8Q76DRAFT_782079 [Earliella scabrosa]|nr:hypothetical protein C8Q76DRAFT_782079 [Earliella scabrosa]
MRPLISYDDITSQPPLKTEITSPPPQPPPKRRKTSQNYRQGGGGRPQAVQHWDDPGGQGMQMNYEETASIASSSAEPPVANEEEYHEGGEEEEEEESRELTHDEIWDDSALIDAWDSAAAEYEAYHGPGKKWKDEPVKKSPLSWYNVPPATTSKSKGKAKATATSNTNGTSTNTAMDGIADAQANPAADSTPLNFDTFVPTHDPSLAAAAGSSGQLMTAPAMDGVSGMGTGADAAAVSQDEAFSRAMTAMYWSGYWTAVYHCRRNETSNPARAETQEGSEENDGEDAMEDMEEMLPAQR